MIFVLIAAIAVVVVLAVLLVRARGAAADAARAADRAELARQDAEATVQVTEERATAAEHQRDEALDRVARIRRDSSEVARRLEQATAEREASERRAGDAESVAAEANGALAALQVAHDELLASHRSTQDALADARRAQDAAVREVAEVRAGASAAAPAVAPVVERMGGGTDDGLTALLWALEAERVTRTWRMSVAIDPTAPSPLDTADDPLREAVEIEATALREEVGTDIEVEWTGGAIPALAGLAVLRVAGESMAALAKRADAVRVVIDAGEGAVIIRAEVDGEVGPTDGVVAEALGEGYRIGLD